MRKAEERKNVTIISMLLPTVVLDKNGNNAIKDASCNKIRVTTLKTISPNKLSVDRKLKYQGMLC